MALAYNSFGFAKFAKAFLVFVSIVLAIARGDPYLTQPCTSENYSGPKETSLHRSPEGGFRCCVNIPIPKGHYVLVCDFDKPDTTSWRTCPEGTFQPTETLSEDMIKCEPRNNCDPIYGLKLAAVGSSISDNVCECDLSKGWYGKEANPKYCYPNHCPPGLELQKNGSCTQCKLGMYKPENGTGLCRHWTQCKTDQKFGNATHDSVCQTSTSTITSTNSSSSNHPEASLTMIGVMSCMLTLMLLQKGMCHM